MSVRNVFFPGELSPNTVVELDETEARHVVKVLRSREGERVGLIDGRGGRALGRVVMVEDGRRRCRCECRVESVERLSPPVPRIHLFVSPPRPKHMDFITETATALGVASITPVFCENSVRFPSRRDRWEASAVVGLKQSGNPFLPKIHNGLGFDEALVASLKSGYFGDVFPEIDGDERGGAEVDELDLWIGPEGGFSVAEKERLQAAGLVPLCVGRWTLRVEIAVPVLLGVLTGARRKRA